MEAKAGTSAGDADQRLIGTGGASPIHGARKARAKISPKPSMTPLRKGRPRLMTSVAVTSKRRRVHGTPGAQMAAIVSSPVGAGGETGSFTLITSSTVDRLLSSDDERRKDATSWPGSGGTGGDTERVSGAARASRGIDHSGCFSRPSHGCSRDSSILLCAHVSHTFPAAPGPVRGATKRGGLSADSLFFRRV